MKSEDAFESGLNSYKKGMPYFCMVPKELHGISSANIETNLIVSYCNGYTTGYYITHKTVK